MLDITVPSYEYYDERTNTFGTTKETVLHLEHSLISVAKWESKWNVPFIGTAEKSVEQCIDYVRCMTINQSVDSKVYYGLTNEMFDTINQYIDKPMTAAWFSEDKNERHGRNEAITADLIYYWMIALNIPFECEKWHLNRLLTLVRVCNLKNAPPKKMTKNEIYARNQALNAARRAKSRTKG